MDWKFWLILGTAGLALSALLCLGTIKWLGSREPYASFLRLRLRGKVRFLRLLSFDPRLPWFVRALPLLALAYWISPIDLIPGFMVDDLVFTLLVIVAIVRFTPRELIVELLKSAGSADSASRQE